jgi:hypothetical protein
MVGLAGLLAACGGGGADAEPPPVQADPTWDLETQGVPRFVDVQYVDLARIGRISRYRSGVGHSFTDGTETCRSMKHYFEPKSATDWATVPLYSPVSGKVVSVLQNGAEAKITIQSGSYPAFWFEIFHVRMGQALAVGTEVAAGQLLGTHIGSWTLSDVAVAVRSPNGLRLVSWFQTLTDAAWQAYAARGAASREAFIVTRAERDADPLQCTGEAPFPHPGSIVNWVALN